MNPLVDFDDAYRSGAQRLVRQLVLIVRDQQEAEDVVQEAWARAYSRSLEQVAAETGVPVGTVGSRLARGRAPLAPLLVEQPFPDGACGA